METGIWFEHILSYMGATEYNAYTPGSMEPTRISYRFELNSYLESIYNGTKEEYKRDVEGSLYYVTASSKTVTKDIVEAFRAHRQKSWDEYLDLCKAKTEEYKSEPDIAKIYLAGAASPIVKGGAYWNYGW